MLSTNHQWSLVKTATLPSPSCTWQRYQAASKKVSPYESRQHNERVNTDKIKERKATYRENEGIKGWK